MLNGSFSFSHPGLYDSRMRNSNPFDHKKKRSLRTILICALLLLLITTGGMLSIHAYFTDSDYVTNSFTVGNNTIAFSQDSEGRGIVQNTGTVPCFIRVFAALENGPAIDSYINKGDGNTQWTQYGDYYYYNSPVAADTATEALFKQSVPGASEDNKLIVYAESIQAEGIAGNAYDAFNQPSAQE